MHVEIYNDKFEWRKLEMYMYTKLMLAAINKINVAITSNCRRLTMYGLIQSLWMIKQHQTKTGTQRRRFKEKTDSIAVGYQRLCSSFWRRSFISVNKHKKKFKERLMATSLRSQLPFCVFLFFFEETQPLNICFWLQHGCFAKKKWYTSQF